MYVHVCIYMYTVHTAAESDPHARPSKHAIKICFHPFSGISCWFGKPNLYQNMHYEIYICCFCHVRKSIFNDNFHFKIGCYDHFRSFARQHIHFRIHSMQRSRQFTASFRTNISLSGAKKTHFALKYLAQISHNTRKDVEKSSYIPFR